MPEIDLRYLFRLTDDTGIFQHAVLGIPDPSEGYTTDDNARALILADMLYERYGGKRFEDLIVRYLSFLLYAERGHWFRNVARKTGIGLKMKLHIAAGFCLMRFFVHTTQKICNSKSDSKALIFFQN
jgi:hypothetical protein